MQQFILFVIKNSNKLLFLLLLLFGLFFTIQNHYYHKNAIINTSNRIAGAMLEQSNKVNSYFDLKKENEALFEENTYLRSVLINQNNSLKTQYKKNISGSNYQIFKARVVNNQYYSLQNYITINAGKQDSIYPEMGVFNSKGVIGVIENSSKNYATIKSILNINQQLNAKTKNSNHKGIITWNGKSTGFVQMNELPRLTTVKKGDTIVTSNSIFFPEGINIGVIDQIFIDNKTSFYTINIRLFNDMTNLGFVNIIKNFRKEEIEQLESLKN